MSKHAEVWSQANCQYCDIAINMLLAKGYSVEEKKIGRDITKEEFITATTGGKQYL